MRAPQPCPFCGGEVSRAGAAEGLCPGCLIDLALEPPLPVVPTGVPDATVTLAFSHEPLSVGPVAGDRYRILALLGRGGMGEVWRADDLKLRVEVALKAVKTGLTGNERALDSLRHEVRTAREVISPNVCRVFDLVELEGQELVSMEYIDGITLADVLETRGPLELTESREIASQFLAGLEAIHDAGLVHRDIKPENLMITPAGRVVVMDFGIAKELRDGEGTTTAGTPAYMSPEQARGEALDARADVFSAGVVLAEMVEPSGTRSFENRKQIWERIHRPLPQLAETPWRKVISKAVSPDREERFASATALARALEEVTLRAAGDENARPYPGLEAFERDDADYFFGRELEVEALWKKLRRPQMLAVIGPSGAGKSSFLRAGLLPTLPEGWDALVVTPGDRPFAALARALAEVLPGDTETVDALLRFEETAVTLMSAWRARHEHTLIVLDQFEELFTQNPADVQASFAELLGRLPLEADLHLLLSMREDFLFHCQSFEALAPIFSELTPIGAPTGAALRRAIVQPALKCGYRFEDESLVEEMLAEVEGERGSLPMLAFAAAQLWQRRDRDQGLLTREAYEEIGGVGGALARHAEQTMERIGRDSVPIVRELFRNLVTAQGTRAARDREDLLSVFGSDGGAGPELGPSPSDDTSPLVGTHEDAGRILDILIDARLLTSYEVPGTEEDEERQTRVEVVHESLLSSWPRLVRWRTQDADGAQLRDQLRQAARAWATRGRPADLLWSGTSYQEFGLWRRRYPGGLTTAEEEFVRAMTAHAERRRRRRRMMVAVVITVLAMGLGIFGTLWRQASIARERAETETSRAQANQLLALGRLEIETDPTGALAYALASLERADDPVTRLFALEALSRGPTAFLLDGGITREMTPAPSVDFSPDGRWLASAHNDGSLKLWSATGGPPKLLREPKPGSPLRHAFFGPGSDRIVSLERNNDVVEVRSVPDGAVLRTISSGSETHLLLLRTLNRFFTFDEQASGTRVRAWPLDGGEPELYGDLPLGLDGWYYQNQQWGVHVDPDGTRLAYVPLDLESGNRETGREVHLRDIDGLGAPTSRLVGRHSHAIHRVRFDPDGSHLATGDDSGEVRIWDLSGDSPEPQRLLRQPPGVVRSLAFDATGSRLAAGSQGGHAALWDLEGPPDADPLLLPYGWTDWKADAVFHPEGDWVATASASGVRVWPIARRYPLDLAGHQRGVSDQVFLPDGRSMASVSYDGTVRLWPLFGAQAGGSRVLLDVAPDLSSHVAVDASGENLLTATTSGQVWLVPLDGGNPRELAGFDSQVGPLALSADGRLAAAAGTSGHAYDGVIRVWDLTGGEVRVLDPGDGLGARALEFTPDGRLISSGRPKLPHNRPWAENSHGIRIWNPADGTFATLSEQGAWFLSLSRDGRYLLAGANGENGEAVLYDLEKGTSTQIDGRGPAAYVGLDPDSRIAVTMLDQVEQLQVGPVTGGAPHLLLSPEPLGAGGDLVVSPDGRWIAMPYGENKIRLFPMPDLSRPPLHTLPHAELLAKLRSLTNLRVVADPESETGWGYDLDPFLGWQEIPTW